MLPNCDSSIVIARENGAFWGALRAEVRIERRAQVYTSLVFQRLGCSFEQLCEF
jgi:hypothetical protein